jgi:hypothetical protein
MSKGIKTVLGIVAAIAIPFIAPVIAGAIGGSALLGGTAIGGFLSGAGGSALVGAGLGAGAAAATGQNPLLGAALGGFGGFAGGGGLSSLFGSGAGAAGGAAGGIGSSGAGVVNAGTVGVTGAAPVIGAGAAGAAAAAPTGLIGSLGSSIAQFGLNPSTLASLALTMFNKPPSGLTDAERAAVQDAAQLASQDQALFRQRVEQARAMLNTATPNPEQAFANVAMQVERQAREATRGGTEFDERRAAIERQRLGAGAVAQEAARATQARVAGLQALPSQAPLGEPSRTLPIYAAAQRREDEYNRDLARAVGGGAGSMFGSRGLFA